jgi:hypothetical protein
VRSCIRRESSRQRHKKKKRGSYSAVKRLALYALLILCPVARAQLSYTATAQGVTSLTFKGVQYSDSTSPGSGIINAYNGLPHLNSGGNCSGGGLTRSISGSTVTGSCTGQSYTYTIIYSQPDANTLEVSWTINNTGSSPITQAFVPVVGILIPHPYNSNVGWSNPAGAAIANPVPENGYADNFNFWPSPTTSDFMPAEVESFSPDTTGWYSYSSYTPNSPTSGTDDMQVLLFNGAATSPR